MVFKEDPYTNILLQHPHMVLVGLHDGNVAVYNLQNKSKAPVFQSSPRNGKHRDVVWQVTFIWKSVDF